MSVTIKADGDRWRAELGAPKPSGRRVLLFFCETTDQRPYRVVEVEPDRFAGAEGLEDASAEELRDLYRSSRSMGAPKAYPTYGP